MAPAGHTHQERKGGSIMETATKQSTGKVTLRRVVAELPTQSKVILFSVLILGLTVLVATGLVCSAFRYTAVPLGGAGNGSGLTSTTGAVVIDRWTGAETPVYFSGLAPWQRGRAKWQP